MSAPPSLTIAAHGTCCRVAAAVSGRRSPYWFPNGPGLRKHSPHPWCEEHWETSGWEEFPGPQGPATGARHSRRFDVCPYGSRSVYL